MPRIDDGTGRTIKVKLDDDLLACLRQDAKDRGEARVQAVLRQILQQHYRQQLDLARAQG